MVAYQFDGLVLDMLKTFITTHGGGRRKEVGEEASEATDNRCEK